MNTAVPAQPSAGPVPASLSDEALARESLRAQAALRQGKWIIIGLRLLFLFVVLGGWELAARPKQIDPFFYSQPSPIWEQIVGWEEKEPRKARCGCRSR